MVRSVKPLEFLGNSRDDLRAFPIEARTEAGFQLFKVQSGENPDNWKSIETVGPGVREIRIRERSGAYRVIYVAKFGQAVYVLHCFQKKTQKTAARDLLIAKQRYKELVSELNQ